MSFSCYFKIHNINGDMIKMLFRDFVGTSKNVWKKTKLVHMNSLKVLNSTKNFIYFLEMCLLRKQRGMSTLESPYCPMHLHLKYCVACKS